MNTHALCWIVGLRAAVSLLRGLRNAFGPHRPYPFWFACIAACLATSSACQPAASSIAEEVANEVQTPSPRPARTETLLTQAAAPTPQVTLAKQKPADKTWQNLFDGQDLGKWMPTQFGGEGDVHVKDGRIILGFGQPMTGITWKGGEIPTVDYELQLEAMRVDGSDFFCALTFPVRDTHCSFVVGGWGGAVVGISSIDGEDASENDTTSFQAFKRGTWYRLRVRVTENLLEAWIDDKRVIDQDIEGRKISTRIEVNLSKPLGISSYDTRAALRKIQLRSLDK